MGGGDLVLMNTELSMPDEWYKKEKTGLMWQI